MQAMATSKKSTTVTRHTVFELGDQAEQAKLRRTWEELRRQLENKPPLGSGIPRIKSPDFSSFAKLSLSTKRKGRKRKRRNSTSRMVELALILFKEAFAPNDFPPRHFTYKEVEEAISPFYEKHGVKYDLLPDTIARARAREFSK
jgi:hypothetical protein